MKGYKRRDLIRWGLLAGGMTLLPTCRAGLGRSPNPSPRILVIGAGIAGLAAARQLHQQGYSVTVLEGRDRIGGRIWTQSSLGVPLDFGAAWIHGVEGNPITQLAREFGVKTVPTDYDAQQLYDGTGRSLTEAEQERLDQEYQQLPQALARYKRRANMTSETSLEDVVQQVMQARSLMGLTLQGVNWHLASNIQIDSGANLSELGLLAYGEDDELEGGDAVFPQGYSQIVQAVAAGLDIQLNQVVRRIAYDPQGVTVTTNQGEVAGTQAIITLPLGVLQQGNVQFSPPLPDRKLAAIQRLGMGTLNKVALRFPRQFWPESPHTLGYLIHNRQQVMEYWNWSQYVQAPVLVALAGGSYARSFGSIPLTQLVKRIMGELRIIFGPEIPDPVQTAMTQWHRDPFAVGSYSICPPGSSLADCQVLAEPVGDRLLFAGEATHDRYPSTVHGALLSGEREADRIMQWNAQVGIPLRRQG